MLDVAHRFQQATDWHRRAITREGVRADDSWEIVIGLETHAQLSTESKIFSGASTAFGAAPNTQASAVDIALPGVLPVLNSGAVERAIRFGLAVGAKINRRSVFARKNYFYPDLPKGYQISQFEIPVVRAATIPIVSPTRGENTIRLTRAHLEEDAGKSLHEDFHGMTGIDLNRAGTPLLEIVSEPDLRSAEEAVAYAKALHALVRWIGICDGNMQEGTFRCDANVSVRPPGEQARHALRDQEPQLLPLHGAGHRLRDAPPDRADRGRRHGRAGNAPLRSGQRRDALDAQQGRCAGLPLLSRSGPAAAGDRRRVDRARCSAEMPELPEAMQAALRPESYGLLASRRDATRSRRRRRLSRAIRSNVRASRRCEAKTGRELGLGDCPRREQGRARNRRLAGSGRHSAALLKRIADGTISDKIAKDVFAAMWAGEHGRCRRNHRGEGLKPDFRRRRAREDRRRRDRRECGDRRRIQGRQGEGVQLAGRPGDGGHQGQGQPGAGQQILKKKLGV